MLLHERPDFRALIEQTASPLDRGMLGAAIVEKDYWITEALRAIATRAFPNVIFKGGTSLTKAWHLTARLSEDVDLLVDPVGLSRKQRDTCLRDIATAVQEQLGLPLQRGPYSEGTHLTAEFTYQTALGQPLLRPAILLEIGTRGSPEPSRMCLVDSLVSRALEAAGVPTTSRPPAFPVRTLHYRRTFVEKLFAIHQAAVRAASDDSALQRQGRHYYDLWCLWRQTDVQTYVHSDQFDRVASDVAAIGKRYWGTQHAAPDGLVFGQSPAVRPDAALEPRLAAAYAADRVLIFGDAPAFSEILVMLQDSVFPVP
ncbi:MAG: nucleotidyl transferase AbiEii/AbiGii toxin family protein [Candidatus Dormibacteria bacterium]